MGILFDLDGTLLDTAPDFIYAIQQMRQEENLPALNKAMKESLRLNVTEGTSALIKIGLDIDREHPKFDFFYQRFLELYRKHLGHFTKPFPGIEDLLKILEEKRIPWGVVTNKHRAFTEPLLKQQGLDLRVNCVVSGDDAAHNKPHPAPLLLACETLQVAPSKCLYIGDAERDIVAGKAAGMTTLVALFGYVDGIETAKKWAADHIIHHADEIFPWFENWSKNGND